MLDRKAKSFEEREQEYERAKRRIFKDMEHDSIEQFWHNWSNSNPGAPDQYKFGGGNGGPKAQNNRLLKVQSSVCIRNERFSSSHGHPMFSVFHSRWTRATTVDRVKLVKVTVSEAMDHNHKGD